VFVEGFKNFFEGKYEIFSFVSQKSLNRGIVIDGKEKFVFLKSFKLLRWEKLFFRMRIFLRGKENSETKKNEKIFYFLVEQVLHTNQELLRES